MNRYRAIVLFTESYFLVIKVVNYDWLPFSERSYGKSFMRYG